MKTFLGVLAGFLAGLKITGAVDWPWWVMAVIYVASIGAVILGALGAIAFVMSHVK